MSYINAMNSGQIQQCLDKYGGVAIIMFKAVWSGPSITLSSVAQRLSQQKRISLIKVDYDESQQLRQAYGINIASEFVLIKGKWNSIIEKVVGGNAHHLQRLFDKAIMCK